mmetsp:Transcript_7217/g.5478  ORF Transcript_7217/g.5478 Transcript_7217/m.5478 type:complete len:188 (+) Transcript_7217:556-1119(+)
MESIERIYEPQRIQSAGLLLVSVLGLLVNMVGLFFFHEHHHHDHGEGEAPCSHHGPADQEANHKHGHHHHHAHENENLHGVFLHILADALGSVGVIFSSILVKYYEMYVADPICSFVISVMILVSVVPLIQMTSSNLIMMTPKSIQNKKNKILPKIEKIKGVYACKELNIWEVSKKNYVAQVEISIG